MLLACIWLSKNDFGSLATELVQLNYERGVIESSFTYKSERWRNFCALFERLYSQREPDCLDAKSASQFLVWHVTGVKYNKNLLTCTS